MRNDGSAQDAARGVEATPATAPTVALHKGRVGALIVIVSWKLTG